MIICVHITTLSMVRDATMCDHADTHTRGHTGVTGLVKCWVLPADLGVNLSLLAAHTASNL